MAYITVYYCILPFTTVELLSTVATRTITSRLSSQLELGQIHSCTNSQLVASDDTNTDTNAVTNTDTNYKCCYK